MNQLVEFLHSPTVTFIIQLASFISAITTLYGAITWITKKLMSLGNVRSTNQPTNLGNLRDTNQVKHVAVFITSMYIALAFSEPLLLLRNDLPWVGLMILLIFIVTIIVFEIHVALNHYFLKGFIGTIGAILIILGLISASALGSAELFLLLYQINISLVISTIIYIIVCISLLILQTAVVGWLSDKAGWLENQ